MNKAKNLLIAKAFADHQMYIVQSIGKPVGLGMIAAFAILVTRIMEALAGQEGMEVD